MRLLRPYRWMRCLCAAAVAVSGCSPVKKFSFSGTSPSYYQNFATQIEYPNVKSCLVPEVAGVTAPLAIENPADLPAWEITLDEAVNSALRNSDILRSLGGSVVQAPQSSFSIYDPALTESNPLGGVDAALSDFDAQVTGALFWQKNNRPINRAALNPIFQQIVQSALEQTTGNFQSGIAKRTATGARFAARHNVSYDNNNNFGRQFASDFVGWFEAEWRQPLLRGAGVDYNRIAGPTLTGFGSGANTGIGQYNGVLIARINTDISLADFEQSVTTFVNDVETAYWELYFAYRNLQTQIAGRASTLRLWQRFMELQKVGARGGEADNEAQGRSQYYLFDAQVKETLAGANGLYAVEQRLRYLMGLPPTDGRLLKPIEDPMEGAVVYDWPSSLGDALTRRVEIRRQKWNIKRRELELVAARMNRRPALDALTQYRYRGLGDHLIGSPNSSTDFDNLYQNILTGDYQEWQAGFELTYPVGFRQASAAIANAQWNLAREQSLLKEQELRISHDLSNAARNISRSYELVQTNYNRQEAYRFQVQVFIAKRELSSEYINLLLQAEQQLASSQSAYFRSLTDYQLALRDFHREKGSLLNYSQIALSESAWPSTAYRNAAERGQFFEPRTHPEAVDAPRPVSSGGFAPHTVGSAPVAVMEPL